MKTEKQTEILIIKIWTAVYNWSKESKNIKSVDKGDYERYYSPAKEDDLVSRYFKGW